MSLLCRPCFPRHRDSTVELHQSLGCHPRPKPHRSGLSRQARRPGDSIEQPQPHGKCCFARPTAPCPSGAQECHPFKPVPWCLTCNAGNSLCPRQPSWCASRHRCTLRAAIRSDYPPAHMTLAKEKHTRHYISCAALLCNLWCIAHVAVALASAQLAQARVNVTQVVPILLQYHREYTPL